jgi:PilZ domain
LNEDRRSNPRYPFVAAAEVVDEVSGAKITTRVSELSLHGCYLDMVNPLPQGTAVIVKIFTDTDFFEAQGTTVYSHQHLGIGVTFRDVKPFYMAILQKWLLAAMHPKAE